jgi:hypothetical protein
MTVDNIEEIKAALAALKERQAPRRRSRIHAVHHPAPAPDPQTTQAAAAAATAGINARRQALSMLGQPNDLYWYYVTLDAFLSNELPSTELGLVQENGTSFMKIYLDSHHNDCPPGGADSQFYFAWKNPSDDYVSVNVWSAVSLNGQAYASASEGNFADLFLTAYLDIWRFTGWGIDPETGQPADGTPYHLSRSSTVCTLPQHLSPAAARRPRPSPVGYRPLLRGHAVRPDDGRTGDLDPRWGRHSFRGRPQCLLAVPQRGASIPTDR